MATKNEIKPTASAEAPDSGRCAVDAGFGTWRTPADAPSATLLLIAWGSKASGPMAYDIGEKRRGKWITDAGQYIETQGYCVCAWMPLPALPNNPVRHEGAQPRSCL